MTTFLHRVLLFLTLLAYGSTWVSPEWLWVTGLLALGIPLLGLVLVAILFYTLLKKRYKTAMYTGVVLLLGWPHWAASIGGGYWQPATAPEGSFSVLSQNVRIFNTDKAEYLTDHIEQLTEVAQREKVDIVCLQEFREIDGHEHRTLENAGFRYRHFFRVRKTGSRIGLAIYARYPISKVSETFFSGLNGALFATVQLPNGRKVRIGNIHLQSLGLPSGGLSAVETWKAALRRFRESLVAHAEQIKTLEKEWEQTAQPVLLCGDFNTTPYSYVYRYLRTSFSNAFENAGRGIGTTYRGKIPFLRIDHQFFSENLHNFSMKTIKQTYSDHHVLVGTYYLSP